MYYYTVSNKGKKFIYTDIKLILSYVKTDVKVGVIKCKLDKEQLEDIKYYKILNISLFSKNFF